MGGTHHVADIRTLDEKCTCQGFALILGGLGPILGAAIAAQLGLEIAELPHVIEVQAHISRKDGADHEIAHLAIGESGRPIPPENLRVSGAVEGLKDGAVVVQLGEWRIQCHQEAVVDSRVSDIVANSGDEECQGLKRAQQRCHW
jgi:hypothetical protein